MEGAKVLLRLACYFARDHLFQCLIVRASISLIIVMIRKGISYRAEPRRAIW